MKKIAIYYFSLAAIVGGSLASCQEADLGFDAEQIARAKFEREYLENFIKEFGQPAPNHQWGFDVANKEFAKLSSTRADAAIGNASVWKQEMTYVNNPDIKIRDYFDTPANITDLEHQEVYAWFTNHKVTWNNTPCDASDPNSRDHNPIATEIVQGMDYGSMTVAPRDYEMVTTFISNFAWVQHVARDTEHDEKCWDNNLNGGSYKPCDYDGEKMTFLFIKTATGTTTSDGKQWVHLNEFNGDGCWGYGRQQDPKTNPTGQNAVLVTNCSFDDFQYTCSAGLASYWDGHNNIYVLHNKWFLVYLEGDGYAGWYLGMDMEGTGENNQIVPANGICNDWIVKISGATPAPDKATSYRVMCEDLGSTHDVDFNDVVFDASFNGEGVFVTLRAAGGTMPISLKYKDTQLTKNDKTEIHSMFGKSVTTPVNVNAPSGSDGLKPITWSFSATSLNTNDFKIFVTNTLLATEEIDLTEYDEKNQLTPYRICVPTTVKWCQESKEIHTVYGGFKDWVSDDKDIFWSDGKPVQTSLLYNGN